MSTRVDSALVSFGSLARTHARTHSLIHSITQSINRNPSDLGSANQTVDLPFGLQSTRPTTINLPPIHYPGPLIGGNNNTLVDELWRATGCPNKTPEWGYDYWPGNADYGVRDMYYHP